jgi:Carbohydrate esterase, sialic acid-specific acetylesterase
VTGWPVSGGGTAPVEGSATTSTGNTLPSRFGTSVEAGDISAAPNSDPATRGHAAELAYEFNTDPRIVAGHEPDHGFADLTPIAPPWGSLIETGGPVSIGGVLDGHAVYQFSKTTGGVLTSANQAVMESGIHLFVVARWTGTPAIGDALLGSARGDPTVGEASGVADLRFLSTTQGVADGGQSIAFVTRPFAFTLYEIYYHSKYSRVSVDGGPYFTGSLGSGSWFSGIELGGFWGGQRSDSEVAFVLVYEGQAPARFKRGLYGYLGAKFPSLDLAAGPPPVFSLDTTAPALWDATKPWNAVIVLGQSNASNYASGSTATWQPGTFLFGNDQTWKLGLPQWDSFIGQTDSVSLDPTGTVGGLAGSFANSLQSAWGIPTVLVPCSLSASFIVPGTYPTAPMRSWDREYPRGQHLRDSLYWSAVNRALQVIKWGGTIKALVWYQGNSEAFNADPAIRSQWPARTQATLDSFWSDIGQPNPRLTGDPSRKTIVVGIEQNAASSAAYPWYDDFRLNVQPSIQRSANQIFVTPPAGPFEADQIHLVNTALDFLGGTTIANAILAR